MKAGRNIDMVLSRKTSNDWHGKCLIVTFNEKGIVDWVTIVYTD